MFVVFFATGSASAMFHIFLAFISKCLRLGCLKVNTPISTFCYVVFFSASICNLNFEMEREQLN